MTDAVAIRFAITPPRLFSPRLPQYSRHHFGAADVDDFQLTG
jgi:hypothetical protein